MPCMPDTERHSHVGFSNQNILGLILPMITRSVRIMAFAAFASTRCHSFIYGGSRFVRTGNNVGFRAGKQFRALPSSPHVEASTTASSEEAKERGNADDLSLDTLLITKNPELVVGHLRARRMGEGSVHSVHRIGELMKSRRKFLMTKETALGKRKTMSAEIGKLMKAGQADEAQEKKREVDSINEVANSAEESLNKVDSDINTLMVRLPNLLDSRVPDGDGEEDNVVVAEWGQEYIKTGEEYLWHDEVAMKLGGWDPEGATKMSGSRFSLLQGQLARLERALGQWMLDLHTTEHGYTEASVPLLVTRSSLEGTGQLPKFEDDLFKTNHLASNEDSFLIPTGEVPLTNIVRGQLLSKAEFEQHKAEEDAVRDSPLHLVLLKFVGAALTLNWCAHRLHEKLPLSLVALTPCFRAEAGSAGRDTRGLLRQHQFLKVELVKITTPEDSLSEHEALTQHAEAVLKALKLPFRRLSLCSGDIGFGARVCYDLEVWMPGQGAFREISSCSNCQDFQARRMALRYKKPAEGKNKSRNLPCHTINGSGVAVGRALVAVLENYFDPEDASVTVPDVLRPYMGGLEKLQ